MTSLVIFAIAALLGPTTAPTVMPNLPDPLVMADGTPVTSARQWREQRRPELLALFSHEMYGAMPSRPAAMTFEVFDEDEKALGGKATRRQVANSLTGKRDGPRIDLLIYLPNGAPRPVPVIFGFNFWGNQTVTSDAAVRLTTSYVDPNAMKQFIDLSGVKDGHATDGTRGTDGRRWPIERILERGYGFVTAYRGDIDPDLSDSAALPAGFNAGVRSLYPELQNRGDNFGAIAAWAWAYSRGMDYLITDADIDSKRVALFGWSRLGKAALWSAANDERFALVLSSEAGSGGGKLFHHDVAENIQRLVTHFPHWYCKNFNAYVGHETTMPFDQHEMLALIAPRPIYMAASEGDSVFDPVGEFMGLKAANPVYQLLGAEGLPAEDIPPLDHAIIGHNGYHRRSGKHDVLPYDWDQYLAFCDRHFQRR